MPSAGFFSQWADMLKGGFKAAKTAFSKAKAADVARIADETILSRAVLDRLKPHLDEGVEALLSTKGQKGAVKVADFLKSTAGETSESLFGKMRSMLGDTNVQADALEDISEMFLNPNAVKATESGIKAGANLENKFGDIINETFDIMQSKPSPFGATLEGVRPFLDGPNGLMSSPMARNMVIGGTIGGAYGLAANPEGDRFSSTVSGAFGGAVTGGVGTMMYGGLGPMMVELAKYSPNSNFTKSTMRAASTIGIPGTGG